MRGFVEVIRPLQIRGWAADGDSPDPVSIYAISKGQVICSGLADSYRADLAGVVDEQGRHGFILNFDRALSTQELNDVEVYVDFRPEPFRLPSLPAARQEPPPPKKDMDDGRRFQHHQRLIPPTAYSDEQAPVFILGAARSGTSAILQGLLASADFAGEEEGHLFDVVEPMLKAVEGFYADRYDEWQTDRNTALSRVPVDFMLAHIRRTVISVAKSLYPVERWLDKTPRPQSINCAPLFKELWPRSKFVFSKRRGLENIRSRLIKFPGISFLDHCKDWAVSMNAWLYVRHILGDSAIEIDQFDLICDPVGSAHRIGQHVVLSEQGLSLFASSLINERPERTTSRLAVAVTRGDLGWSDDQHKIFDEICGALMDKYEYTYDKRYRT